MITWYKNGSANPFSTPSPATSYNRMAGPLSRASQTRTMRSSSAFSSLTSMMMDHLSYIVCRISFHTRFFRAASYWYGIIKQVRPRQTKHSHSRLVGQSGLRCISALCWVF